MHNRLSNQFLFLGLSLGVLCVAPLAHADPAEPSAQVQHEDADANEKVARDEVSAVSVKNVTLANGAGSRAERDRLLNRPLFITSTTLFAAGYLPTFITAMANPDDTTGNLYIPVAGPWIEIGKDTSPGNRALLVFSGLLQGAGALGMVGSFFVPEARTERWPLMGQRRVKVTPVAGGGIYQLAAHGSF